MRKKTGKPASFDYEEMRRMRRLGFTAAYIAKELGCPASMVYRETAGIGMPLKIENGKDALVKRLLSYKPPKTGIKNKCRYPHCQWRSGDAPCVAPVCYKEVIGGGV